MGVNNPKTRGKLSQMDKWQEWKRIIKDLEFPLVDIINV